MGSLHTFKLKFEEENKQENMKEVAYEAKTQQTTTNIDKDENEGLVKTFVLLSKNFN